MRNAPNLLCAVCIVAHRSNDEKLVQLATQLVLEQLSFPISKRPLDPMFLTR